MIKTYLQSATLGAFLLASPALFAQAGSSAWLGFELGAPCDVASAVAASNAYRGSAFLFASETGVSQSGSTAGPITMHFSPPIDRLTFRAASVSGSGGYDVFAYNGTNQIVRSYGGTFGWMLFSFSPDVPMDRVVIQRRTPAESDWVIDEVSVVRSGASIGTVLCDRGYPQFNTTAASLMAEGENTGGGPYTELTFSSVGGPRNGIGLVLASVDGTYIQPNGGISYLGRLCLRGQIRRLQILSYNTNGFASSPVDLTQLPGPMVGARWYFQAWHRFDSPYAYGSTGFTNSLEVNFE